MPVGIIDLFDIQLHTISLAETEIQVSSPNCNLKKPHRPICLDTIGSCKLLSMLRTMLLQILYFVHFFE